MVRGRDGRTDVTITVCAKTERPANINVPRGKV